MKCFNRKDFYTRAPISQPHPGIFVFQLFKPKLCGELMAQAAVTPREQPNSMNKYGTTLEAMKLGRWAAQLAIQFVNPLRRDYYPEIGFIDSAFGFLVQYEGGKQKKLDAHVDDGSRVTLNVCLTRNFTGGNLVFYGPRKEVFEIAHKEGQAIVHRGNHVHRAKPIEGGQRTNLILWCE